ncbi:MAG TPA: uracil-DNA glycosylase [Candidatus Woesearchaeota archaeon]|nr:uracil-DNA glycosylase [Candidatus Woesearchaeota archaeon]
MFSDPKFPKEKETLLNSLYAKIKSCTKCELSKTKNNYVFGQGFCDSKILFVGEAPGFWEDQKGEPFVGRAGKFLDTLLEHISLNRKDVYIANILKCRPPENRDPNANEILACTPFLDELIRIIKPKIIVALGRHSMGYLFEKFNIKKAVISKIHGEHFNINDDLGEFFVIALYHPAVALYNPGMRDVLKKDFEKIKKLIN